MAFSNTKDSSSFVTGMTNFTHIHLRIDELEQSENHRNCAEAYLLRSSLKTMKYLLMRPQMSLHRQQVHNRQQEHIIDVITLIGNKGLSHRGKLTKAA